MSTTTKQTKGLPAVYSEVHDGWAEVVLNRPARKNAINGPLGIGLASTVQQLSDDERVKVILLRGAGGAFCSGLDLTEFNTDPEPEWLSDFQTIWRQAHTALFECKKPIIGAMQRYAINGGAALALACDLLVVGESSFLQVGEIQIGMAAPYNLAWLSLRHSEAVVAQLTLIGDRVTGPDLVQLGLAYQTVADDEVVTHAQSLASRMAGFEGEGPMRIKAGLRAGVNHTADEWFERFTAAASGGARTRPKRNVSK